MAEDFTPLEDFTPDEAEVNDMKNRDSWEQTQDGFAKPPEQETSFDEKLPDVPDDTPVPLAVRDKFMDFRVYMRDSGYTIDIDAPLINKAFPKMDNKNALFIKYEEKYFRLTQKNNSNKFLSYSTLIQSYGTQFVRDVLGIKPKQLGIKPKRPEFPPKQRKKLLDIDSIIASTKSSPERPESIEMQTVEQVEEGLNTFLETSTQTELALGPPGSLPFRELAGLDRSLRNMRTTVLKITSEREVKKARVKELKDKISKVAYDEDGEVQFSEDLREKQREIKTLEEEIETLDSVIREYDDKFRGQFERIKQTIDKMLNQDMTLGERIQTLFREQGITITSVITALGLAIGMIINSILSAAKSIVPPAPPAPTPKPTPPAPTPTPEPPAPTPGIKGWIKEQLRNIANLLLKLADKMLIALPGIIGSVVSFVLKAASTAVGFISEHLWLLIVALVGLLYNYVQSLSLSSSLSSSLSQSPHYNRSKSNTKKRKK